MKRIMLVEDEIIIALDQADRIRAMGYDVVLAHDGETAVRTALSDPTISLILSDIDLGRGMDGTEAVRIILADRRLPVIFLTSHSEKAMVDRVREITRYGYVLKNSGDFVINSSIEMAFELFEAHAELEITGRRLRESEEFSREIVRQAASGIVLYDRSFNILRWNAYMEDMTGFMSPDVAGRCLFDVFPNLRDRKIDECLSLALGGKVTQANDISFTYHPLGRTVWYQAVYSPYRDTLGDIIGVLASITDITERKENELELISQKKELESTNEEFQTALDDIVRSNEDLRVANEELSRAKASLSESENRYRALFDHTHTVILLVDPENGDIVDVNTPSCAFYGYTAEQMRAMKITDINRLKPDQVFESMLRAKEHPRNRFEFVHRLADGTEREVEVFSGPITLDGRNLLISVVNDITDQKAAERKIADLLEEKERILSEVHHRIKNNMMLIASIFDLSAHHYNDPSVQEALKSAKSRVKSMMVLYDRLYQCGEYRTQRYDVYLPELIDEIRRSYSRPGIAITADIEDIRNDISVVIPVGMIINELVTNAVKYAFPEGKEGTVSVYLRTEGKGMVLRVEDDGIGLPGGLSVDDSTSFGFFFIRAMVRQLRGELTVDRAGGTRYAIVIPFPGA